MALVYEGMEQYKRGKPKSMIPKYLLSISIITLCFTNVLRAMDDKAYNELLRKAAQEHNLNLQEREQIVQETYNWALIHNPGLLKEVYDKLVVNYMDTCIFSSPKEKTCIPCLNFLDRYANVNHDNALRNLEHLIKRTFKHIRIYPHSGDKPKFPIEMLKVLKKMDTSKFELTSKELVTEKFDSLLLLALAHPKEIGQLEDKTLSVDGLIKTVLHKVQANPKETENLKNILQYGMAYHIQFEGEIAQLLPNALENSRIERDLIELFKSPSQYLREKSLSTILDCIANERGGVEDKYRKKRMIKYLFKHENDASVQGAKLYIRLFNTFLKSTSPTSDFGMQMLIKHLMNKPTNEALGRSLLGQYLNISSKQSFQSQQLSINDSFKLAVETEAVSLEQLSNICAVAQESEFERSIEPDIIQKTKMKMILHEGIPHAKRAQFLNEFLIARIASQENYADLAKHIDQLLFSPFKRYAQAIFIALDPELHNTARFGALSNQYPEIHIASTAYYTVVLDLFSGLLVSGQNLKQITFILK